MNLGLIDIIFSFLLIIGVFRGLFRGFINEVVNFATLIGGLFGAMLLGESVAALLDTYVNPHVYNIYIAYFLVFIAIAILLRLLEGVISGIVEQWNLETLDKVLGLAAGGVEGLLLIYLSIAFIEFQPLFPPENILGDSVFYHWFAPFLPQGKILFEEGIQNLNV